METKTDGNGHDCVPCENRKRCSVTSINIPLTASLIRLWL